MKRTRRIVGIENIENAETKHAKAIAKYGLGLFHDKNGREAEAIPHHREALRLGLDVSLRARLRKRADMPPWR